MPSTEAPSAGLLLRYVGVPAAPGCAPFSLSFVLHDCAIRFNCFCEALPPEVTLNARFHGAPIDFVSSASARRYSPGISAGHSVSHIHFAAVRRFTKNRVNRLICGRLKVGTMDLEDHAVIPIVERALAMSAVGREGWCVEWAKWLWSQEIEIAVYEAKQATLKETFSQRQPIVAEFSSSNVHLTAGPNEKGLWPGWFTINRVNHCQSGALGGDEDEQTQGMEHPGFHPGAGQAADRPVWPDSINRRPDGVVWPGRFAYSRGEPAGEAGTECDGRGTADPGRAEDG